MKRNLSAGAVTIAGLLFAATGGYAMWTGWDMILLERGWSLFIAGSVILSSGLVTVALGRVIAYLARIATQPPVATPEPARAPAAPAPEAAPATPAFAPSFKKQPAEASEPASPRPRTFSERTFSENMTAVFEASRAPRTEEPTEVDRYEAGGSTYIMMSDGSVEVLGPNGRQRYPSIAALKADAGLRQD